MHKKVYIKDLNDSEILQRLLKGQKFFDDFSETEEYIKYNEGFITSFDDKDKIVAIGREFHPRCGSYFVVDEVEEPEIDKSCIGKLCYFWDNDDEPENLKFVSVLIELNHDQFRTSNFQASDGNWYEYCKPLTPTEAKALIKE